MRSPRAYCTSPADGSSSPSRIRSNVVLPTPFGPTRPMRARCGMLSVTSLKISTGPNDLARLLAVSKDMIFQIGSTVRHKPAGDLLFFPRRWRVYHRRLAGLELPAALLMKGHPKCCQGSNGDQSRSKLENKL